MLPEFCQRIFRGDGDARRLAPVPEARPGLRGTSASSRRRRRGSVPTEYPRRSRGVAATRPCGISTSQPRRRRDPSPRNPGRPRTRPLQPDAAEKRRTGFVSRADAPRPRRHDDGPTFRPTPAAATRRTDVPVRARGAAPRPANRGRAALSRPSGSNDNAGPKSRLSTVKSILNGLNPETNLCQSQGSPCESNFSHPEAPPRTAG